MPAEGVSRDKVTCSQGLKRQLFSGSLSTYIPVFLHSLKSDGHGEEVLSVEDENDSTRFCIGAGDSFDNGRDIGPEDGDKVGLRVLGVGRCVGKFVGFLDALVGAGVGLEDGAGVSTLRRSVVENKWTNRIFRRR